MYCFPNNAVKNETILSEENHTRLLQLEVANLAHLLVTSHGMVLRTPKVIEPSIAVGMY
jgi:hypothetical protein